MLAPPSRGRFFFLGYNLPLVRFSTMIRLFFVLYCFEAGLLLIFAPWMPEWERIMMQIAPFQALRGFLLYPWFRGAITGFGMVHLVWGAHDLISLLFRRPTEAAAPPHDSQPTHDSQDVPAARDH